MPSTPRDLINYLRDVIGAWKYDPRSDAELVAKFAESRDDTAFKVLVGRHGALVWRTCRRMLGNTPDAEDVFQTTFLTLTRKAGSFPVKSLAGWLHRVAWQAALNVNADTRRRQGLKRQIQGTPQAEVKGDVDQAEFSGILDEELAALPEKLRMPLILHFLEEKTQDEIASYLGCSQSSVKRRLTRGETVLRKRLEQRGVVLGAGSIAALLGNAPGSPAMPAGLIASTARAAVAFRAGTLTSTSAEAAEKLLHSLSMKGVLGKGWWLVLAASVCSLGSLGAGLAIWKIFVGGSDGKGTSAVSVVVSTQSDNLQVRNAKVDVYGDPLPKDAVARIGTVRLRAPGGDYYWPMWNVESNFGKWFNVDLSPDGRILASSYQDGYSEGKKHGQSIRFWDVATGKQLHETVVEEVCEDDDNSRIVFSPDNKLLAVTTNLQKIWLIDVATGQPSGKLLSGGWPFAFTADNKMFAHWDVGSVRIKSGGPSFTLYDFGTRKPIKKMEIAGADRNANFIYATFSHDGRFLVCLEGIGVVHLVDIKTGKELATLKEQPTVALAISPDDSVLVTGGKNKIVRAWDAKTGKELRQFGTMIEEPTLVGFMPNGKTVLAACTGQICHWDMATGRETQPSLSCKDLLSPRILSADGTRLIERVRDSLNIWDVATGKQTGPTSDATRSYMDNLSFSPDGKMLATLGRFGESKIQLWEVATGKPLGTLPTPPVNFDSMFIEMAWPSQNVLLAQEFALRNKPRPTVFRWTKLSPNEASIEPEAYGNSRFSPDGRILACERNDNIEFIEIASGKKIASTPSQAYPFSWLGMRCAFSADHQIFATQFVDKSAITLIDVTSGRELYYLNLPEHPRPGRLNDFDNYDILIGLSPDGRLVVTQDRFTKVVSLWEHVSGRLRLRLPGSPDCSMLRINDNSVAFSPDSRLFAIGYTWGSKQERLIRVWDLVTDQEHQCFRGHKTGSGWAGAPCIVFSPDGRRLASAGMDYTVLIWDVQQPPDVKKLGQPLDQKEIQDLKRALVSVDAEAAYRAICKLCQVPEQAVSLAAECLIPPPPSSSIPDAKQISKEVNYLIDNLDSNDYQTRKKAAEELRARLHKRESEWVVENILFEASAKKHSVEVSRALTVLLSEVKERRESQGWEGIRSPELTRMVRAVEILERVNNAPARELLVKLVESPPLPEIRHEAVTALKRLGASQSVSSP